MFSKFFDLNFFLKFARNKNFGIMNQGKTVFAQLMSTISKYEFEKCVERYKGNYKVYYNFLQRNICRQAMLLLYTVFYWVHRLRTKHITSCAQHQGIITRIFVNTLFCTTAIGLWNIKVSSPISRLPKTHCSCTYPGKYTCFFQIFNHDIL